MVVLDGLLVVLLGLVTNRWGVVFVVVAPLKVAGGVVGLDYDG